jgi:hypothetical protein
MNYSSNLDNVIKTTQNIFPWFIIFLIKNRPHAKAWLAEQFPCVAEKISYRQDLVDYLRIQKKNGRKLYLVSASDIKNVSAVAQYIGLFDGAYGSDGKINLKGTNKLNFIIKHISADFVYAGDCHADKHIWNKAKGAILCGKSAGFLDEMIIPVEAVFKDRRLFPF